MNVGKVKKTALTAYSNPRSKGIIAISLDDKDEPIAVRRTTGNNDLVIGTRNGLSIKFNEEDVRDVGRAAKGVRGIRLRKGNEVVAAEVAEEKTAILTVAENGFGKRTKIEDYPLQGRGGKGVLSIKLTEKGGKVVGLLQVRECVSGAAPLSKDIMKFFQSIDLMVKEAYGSTECTGVFSMPVGNDIEIGTTGKPIPGWEYKIASDGEILIKGPAHQDFTGEKSYRKGVYTP